MNQVDKAITSQYLSYRVNEDIPIYEGRFCIWINHKKYKCKGKIYYKMNTPISINFKAKINFKEGEFIELDDECEIISLEVHGYKKILVTINTLNENWVEGYVINNYIKTKDTYVDYVDFNIINFNQVPGKLIKNDEMLFAGRIEFDTTEYEITIDKRYDYRRELHDELKSKSGNLITHIGRIRRKDKRKISTRDISNTIEKIIYALMFICGRYLGVCIIQGFDEEKLVFRMWQESIITPFEFVPTWTDTIANYHNIEKYMSLMCRKIDDDYYGGVIKNVIDWYIESSGNMAIENNIVSIQIALETLAFTLIVEQHKKITEEQFEANRASENIRLLLETCNIHYGKDELIIFDEYIRRKFQDGCEILTYFRNKIVHPRKKTNEIDFSIEDMWYILQIGTRYVELIVLVIIGYRGEYSNRLEDRSYGEVEVVPWNKT